MPVHLEYNKAAGSLPAAFRILVAAAATAVIIVASAVIVVAEQTVVSAAAEYKNKNDYPAAIVVTAHK